LIYTIRRYFFLHMIDGVHNNIFFSFLSSAEVDAVEYGLPQRNSTEVQVLIRERQARIIQILPHVQKSIVELKQVARSIMQTYIYNGSEAQLNLPETLR
jgi:hypothetical protein